MIEPPNLLILFFRSLSTVAIIPPCFLTCSVIALSATLPEIGTVFNVCTNYRVFLMSCSLSEIFESLSSSSSTTRGITYWNSPISTLIKSRFLIFLVAKCIKKLVSQITSINYSCSNKSPSFCNSSAKCNTAFCKNTDWSFKLDFYIVRCYLSYFCWNRGSSYTYSK